MNSLGICIGASTLSAVGIESSDNDSAIINSLQIKPHHGNPRLALKYLLQQINYGSYQRIVVTGRKFRHLVNLTSISEVEAIEKALERVTGGQGRFNAVVSAGAESFLVYLLGKDGRISSVQTGNKCASGTGDFFVQQLGRIGIELEDSFAQANGEAPYKVSGRCSVFCKSDCTHATNKGVPKGRIVAGLCEMMAGKILEILKQTPRNSLVLIGGTAQNPIMVEFLSKEIENLLVPAEAPYFEAYGAALWGLDNDTKAPPNKDELFQDVKSSFSFQPKLLDFLHLVDFKTTSHGKAQAGDECIIGLDVGSTTTKAVLLRLSDDKIIASVYLRTQGNPVGASRECYARLRDQLGPLADTLQIKAVGVTGSGRQIAGLHAMTDGIINEIIAHATGALFFDSEVDTIFEIGGQDAKYTFIRQGVPSDYAMNDACSAGTGSFLEEAAKETMGLGMESIADIALLGLRPPNFNDQCAAFISSDIKTASHEGLSQEDIVAGLVYSVCQNYNNRVKGNREIGHNIFMQGGVCYNRAVPLAMAALTGKKIVVPPDPGLIGAFGVALEIKKRLQSGLIAAGNFSLHALRDREIDHEKSFTCHGGKEKCDRKCEISRIRIEGRIYPFGGACNRWYNERYNLDMDAARLNLVRKHEDLTFNFSRTHQIDLSTNGKTIGLNRSFFMDAYYPLFYDFFSRLGFKVILPDRPAAAGIDQKRSAFCYPAELAHGFFLNLLDKAPDYLVIPQVKGTLVEGGARDNCTCPISQGEPYYLSSTFSNHPTIKRLTAEGRLLKPVLNFSASTNLIKQTFSELASQIGVTNGTARAAFDEAFELFAGLQKERADIGQEFLSRLDEDPERFAVVIFGRPYNAFVSEANMGIPQKIASRGIEVIPFDFLPLAQEKVTESMYWSSGQSILKGAALVARHPQLFPCYISNFSCGPDSFLGGYFREQMGRKPFILLELDSHVADAGLETRIEAFLDIIRNYRQLERQKIPRPAKIKPRPARYDAEKRVFIDSQGHSHAFDDPRVHLIFPSMGARVNEAAAAVFNGIGIKASALPAADEEVLKLGRGNSSCKECLPLQLTLGSLIKYLRDREEDNELLVYFMPTAAGPCRFGQYSTFITSYIERMGIENVALFSLPAETSYSGGFGDDVTLKLWSGLILSQIMEDLHSHFLVNAVDPPAALQALECQWRQLIMIQETSPSHRNLKQALKRARGELARVALRRSWEETPAVLLTGEIYVRHDGISRQYLVEKLAAAGFITKVSSIMEWIYYTDWLVRKKIDSRPTNLKNVARLALRSFFMRRYEKDFKEIMAEKGLLPCHLEDVDKLINKATHVIDPRLTGEAILTVGGALAEVPRHYSGVIAIGPFGCMPNQIAEAILSTEMRQAWQESPRSEGIKKDFPDLEELPFLAIESDGNPFPQIINAKLEVFMMQARRLHDMRHPL